MNNKTILLIAVLIVMVGFIGFQLNKPSQELRGAGDTWIKSDATYATTSISVCKRSIYRPTSTDDYAWVCATSSWSGTPSLLLAANVGRQSLEIYSSQDIYIWLANATTGSMVVGSNSSGTKITTTTPWNMKDYGIIWTGKIYAIANTATSTVQTVEY